MASVSTRQNLTDPILYHLPRWSSPRKLDHIQERWLISETVLWTDCSVVDPPPFRHDLWFHVLPILGYESDHGLP